MAIGKVVRLGVCLCGIILAAGCSAIRSEPMVTKPDGTTMPQDTYLEEARLNAIGNIWAFGKEAAKPPDSPGNVSAEGEVSHTWFKDDLTKELSTATQSVGSGKFDVDIVRIQERHGTARSVINNLPWFLSAVGAVGGGGSDSVKITADGQSRIDNIDMTIGDGSPFITGSDNMAASDDGQVIDGEGNTQGQAVSRPNTQNDLDFAGDGGAGDESPGGGSNNNIRSEGLGFEGSL